MTATLKIELVISTINSGLELHFCEGHSFATRFRDYRQILFFQSWKVIPSRYSYRYFRENINSFQGFQRFHLDYSTLAATVLKCSRLPMNVPILQTFIVYGVSAVQSSDLTCQKKRQYFPGYFVLRAFPNCT